MRPRLLAGVLAAALAVTGCLPSSVGPTPPPTAAPTATATPAPTPSPTPAPPTPTPAPTFVLHTVAIGDSLTSIARRYETTGRSLAYWNREAYPSLDPESPDYDPDWLQVGWVLRVMPGTEYVPPEDEGPTPTPGPVASLVIPPGPTPAAGTSVVVSNGGRGGNALALTFDMGGDLEPDAAVATWLVEHDVPATIFPTGVAATESADGRAVVALAAAHPDVLTLGNGGWDGRDMTTLGAAGIADQLARADDALAAATGRSTRPLFRPPDGAQDRAVRDAAGAAGWPYTVLWDVDTLDGRLETDGGPSAGDIVAKVLSRARGGSIVLLHIGGEHTLEALPEIVDGLRSRGLEPVTLHRLLGVDPGG